MTKGESILRHALTQLMEHVEGYSTGDPDDPLEELLRDARAALDLGDPAAPPPREGEG